MKHLLAALHAFVLLGLAAPALAQQPTVPVVIPPDDGQAADCATSTVTGLDSNGDNFLAVRAGPGTAYPMIDRLRNGQVVWTCAAQGGWVGIHYPRPGHRSGWVSGRYLKDLAG